MANTKFEAYPDKAGDYRWQLKSSSGHVTAAAAESFSSKAAPTHAPANRQGHAATAEVVVED
jgi:uncharacterized protein YegP (UPF0339 family)